MVKIPEIPKDYRTLVANLKDKNVMDVLQIVSEPTWKGKYLHWDDLRHRPVPTGLNHDEWWLGLKMARMVQQSPLPLATPDGRPFLFTVPAELLADLHDIERRAGGMMGAPDQVVNPETRNRYLLRNLMEEGIHSSLIEGACTTREKAKEMLESKRPPKDKAEQMVTNNFAAMQYIIDLGSAKLTPEVVMRLQEILTNGTMNDATASGRLRRADEPVEVADAYGEVLHVPPPAAQLPARLAAMCDFANGHTPTKFVHPIVRSIALHFWLAYDHPFKDGNGRTARALFYWSMLRNQYWLCQFFSISQIILRAPIQYARAYLYSETDGNDLTYFLFHQTDVIKKALDELHKYIEERLQQRREVESHLRLRAMLNARQIELIGDALRNPTTEYDIKRHQNLHQIVYETARNDLLDLTKRGLLIKRKQSRGKKWIFAPAPNLQGKLEKLKVSGRR